MNRNTRHIQNAKKPNVLTFILAAFMLGAIFTWFNHVLYWHRFAYLQWCVVAEVWLVLLVQKRGVSRVMYFVLTFMVLAQVCAWVGMITLPLIKP